jgi:hypothetical protein
MVFGLGQSPGIADLKGEIKEIKDQNIGIDALQDPDAPLDPEEIAALNYVLALDANADAKVPIDENDNPNAIVSDDEWTNFVDYSTQDPEPQKSQVAPNSLDVKTRSTTVAATATTTATVTVTTTTATATATADTKFDIYGTDYKEAISPGLSGETYAFDGLVNATASCVSPLRPDQDYKNDVIHPDLRMVIEDINDIGAVDDNGDYLDSIDMHELLKRMIYSNPDDKD